MLNVIMLSVLMLSDVMLSVLMPSVVFLNYDMSFVFLSDILSEVM